MKTTLLRLLVLAPFLSMANAHAETPAWPVNGESPVAVVKVTGSSAQFLPVVNSLNDSFAYATATTLIKNGSGTRAPQPMQSQPVFDQALRQLSLFDLYFSYAVASHKVQNVSARLDVVPYTDDLDSRLKNFSAPGFENSIGILSQSIVQQNRNMLKAYPSTLSEYGPPARAAELAALAKRYPNVSTFSGSDSEKIKWLANSFLPVATDLNIVAKNGTGSGTTTFLFPAVGMLDIKRDAPLNSVTVANLALRPLDFTSRVSQNDAGYMPDIPTMIGKIYRIAYTAPKQNIGQVLRGENLASRAIRAEFTKNFAQPDLLTAELTFGSLRSWADDPFTMDVDTESGTDLASEMDMGMVAYGDLDITPGLIKDESIRTVANKYAHMIEFKLGFHKLSFQLSRSPYKTPAGPVVFNYWSDIGTMFQIDPGFQTANLHLVPEKSVMTFSIAIKPQYLEELKSVTFLQGLSNLDKARQRDFVSFFCSMSQSYEGEAGVLSLDGIADFFSRKGMENGCEIKATSLADFKKKLFSAWLNRLIMNEVDKGVASSVDGEIAKASAQIDPMIQDLTARALGIFERTRAQVASAVATLQK